MKGKCFFRSRCPARELVPWVLEDRHVWGCSPATVCTWRDCTFDENCTALCFMTPGRGGVLQQLWSLNCARHVAQVCMYKVSSNWEYPETDINPFIALNVHPWPKVLRHLLISHNTWYFNQITHFSLISVAITSIRIIIFIIYEINFSRCFLIKIKKLQESPK